jgi:hypothetical protein
MRTRILGSAAIWICLITAAHVWLNVGFANLGQNIQVMLGKEKKVLQVGFLPVT